MASCAPSARFFNVDVRDKDAVKLPLADRPVAVLSIYGDMFKAVTDINKLDSVNISNVAVGVAERLEEEYSVPRGNINVYSIHEGDHAIYETMVIADFPTKQSREARERAKKENKLDPLLANIDAYDQEYVQRLLIKTGAQVFITIERLKFQEAQVRKSDAKGADDNVDVIIPFRVGVGVFDGITNRHLYSKGISDSVYMEVMPSVIKEGKLESTLLAYMPEISRKVGAKIASMLAPQWVTQERMLITFEGESAWNAPYLMAEDFRWKEAVEAWMELAKSKNPKRAAYAAFNIAVGCEMMEQFDLAVKWIDFSIKKYRFPEAVDLRDHLLELQKETVDE